MILMVDMCLFGMGYFLVVIAVTDYCCCRRKDVFTMWWLLLLWAVGDLYGLCPFLFVVPFQLLCFAAGPCRAVIL